MIPQQMSKLSLIANLLDEKTIEVLSFERLDDDFKADYLLKDHNERLSIAEKDKSQKRRTYVLSHPISLGHSYFLETNMGMLPLCVSNATEFPGFDEKYSPIGERLGAFYSPSKTTFSLFAPLASRVEIKIEKDGKTSIFPLVRDDSGVWKTELAGDYESAVYTYLVTNNEVTMESIDPYAKGSLANSSKSVVIDLSKFASHSSKRSLPPLRNKTDAIIYEGSVRDLTSDNDSNIINKGRFLGLTERGKVTKNGHPAGLDYLKWLGITHLQLLPIFDFSTLDELDPSSSYNWGYDPSQYFLPEGSYSSDPNDAYLRIKEAKEMIDALHQEGIRVVMDVVFNHVYDWSSSSFEKTTPNYYFRKKGNGELSNVSWCGNDLDTARPMVRKLIVEAAEFWIDFYEVDGFRFDLMGLIDVDTIKEIEEYASKKDPSFIVYGEGWNMMGEKEGRYASMTNHDVLPNVSFFNDFFREANKRYIGGDLKAQYDYKFSFLGSSVPFHEKEAMFLDASQSINYIECHDNKTFYDHLHYGCLIKDDDELFLRCKMGIASVIFSHGIPFIHMGQETAQSKNGEDNTYNKGDEYNALSYKTLDERWPLAHYLKDCITIRKSLQCVYNQDPSSLAKATSIEDLEKGLRIKTDVFEPSCPYQEVNIFLNPSSSPYVYALDSDQSLLLMSGETLPKGIKGQSLLIPKCSILISALEKSH